MSSEWELDEGIKSIKSAWRREHTARANLEKMLEQAEVENAKLQELIEDTLFYIEIRAVFNRPPTEEMYEEFAQRARELGVEVDDD